MNIKPSMPGTNMYPACGRCGSSSPPSHQYRKAALVAVMKGEGRGGQMLVLRTVVVVLVLALACLLMYSALGWCRHVRCTRGCYAGVGVSVFIDVLGAGVVCCVRCARIPWIFMLCIFYPSVSLYSEIYRANDDSMMHNNISVECMTSISSGCCIFKISQPVLDILSINCIIQSYQNNQL
jgi:hypothetical protein